MHLHTVVNSNAPTMHCEACGATVAADAADAEYCLVCDLMVCANCWSVPEDLCATCAVDGAMQGRDPPVIRTGVETSRRADRRLREAMRDALVLPEARVPVDGHDARVEHASLAIKATVAERVGTRALGRLTGAGVAGAPPWQIGSVFTLSPRTRRSNGQQPRSTATRYPALPRRPASPAPQHESIGPAVFV